MMSQCRARQFKWREVRTNASLNFIKRWWFFGQSDKDQAFNDFDVRCRQTVSRFVEIVTG